MYNPSDVSILLTTVVWATLIIVLFAVLILTRRSRRK